MGKRRRDLGLHFQARQLHGFPLAVYRFPLSPDQHAGVIPGYHCWAQFHVELYGWIPVDASEAWKHPNKKDYFFGAHDDNRIQPSA
jgi:hypothetical protein